MVASLARMVAPLLASLVLMDASLALMVASLVLMVASLAHMVAYSHTWFRSTFYTKKDKAKFLQKKTHTQRFEPLGLPPDAARSSALFSVVLYKLAKLL